MATAARARVARGSGISTLRTRTASPARRTPGAQVGATRRRRTVSDASEAPALLVGRRIAQQVSTNTESKALQPVRVECECLLAHLRPLQEEVLRFCCQQPVDWPAHDLCFQLLEKEAEEVCELVDPQQIPCFEPPPLWSTVILTRRNDYYALNVPSKTGRAASRSCRCRSRPIE